MYGLVDFGLVSTLAGLGTYELISEFVDHYYGKAAGPVAEFLRLADTELRRAGNHPG